jgi:dihydropteroate synthase
MLVGASRKSFIGHVLGDAPVSERLSGSLAAGVIAVWQGAEILRVHDVRETADAVRVAEAIKKEYEDL